MITLKNISFRKNTKQILTSINMSINNGEIYGIIGPPGSGKTILLNCIAGQCAGYNGSILINKQIMHKKSLLKKVSSYTPVSLDGREETVFDFLTLARLQYKKIFASFSDTDIQVVETYLDLFHLKEIKDNRLMTLSECMIKRVRLAFTFIREAPVICLDNPTNGLDIKTLSALRNVMHRYVIEGNNSIIVAAHDLNFLSQTCDRIIILYEGKIKLEGDSNIFTAALIKKYFGSNTMISKNIYNGKPEIHIFPEN